MNSTSQRELRFGTSISSAEFIRAELVSEYAIIITSFAAY